MSIDLEGLGVALVTPFKENYKVDFDAFGAIIDHVSQGGVDYLVILGTTGEAVTLSTEEKLKILRFAVNHNPRKLPIVFGHGGNNTQALVEALSTIDFEGITAILSASPAYNKPSQSGIVLHYQALADHSPVPIILYNVPARTSSNMTAETTLTLAVHENIVGIKEASGNLVQCMQIAKEKPQDFLLISGDDMLTTPIMSVGGVGLISVLANAFPQQFKRIIKSAHDGDYANSAETASEFLELNPLMYQEGNPSGIKEVLSQLGLCAPFVRPPMDMVSRSLKKDILARLGQWQ